MYVLNCYNYKHQSASNATVHSFLLPIKSRILNSRKSNLSRNVDQGAMVIPPYVSTPTAHIPRVYITTPLTSIRTVVVY